VRPQPREIFAIFPVVLGRAIIGEQPILKEACLRYVQHSKSALAAVYDVDQSRLVESPCGIKPNGLWFSVGDGADWRALSATNRWNVDDVKFQTEIVFSEYANILRAEGAADIDKLTSEYGKNDGQAIDWRRVAETFDAIIIAPLCVERSGHDQTRWYRWWECSCGCVWQSHAVKRLRPINY
jgi:hypothetical protein